MVATWRLLFLLLVAAASFGSEDCADVAYQNHNQIDYGPLIVPSINGVAQDKSKVGVPDVCIVLFTDDMAHKRVGMTKADRNGSYALPELPEGKYRLVAAVDPFCAANVPVVVKHSAKKHSVVIVFQPRGLDSCSYGEYAPSREAATSF